jgi:hypothetical protein
MADIGIDALKTLTAEVFQPRVPPDYIYPDEHHDYLIDLIDTIYSKITRDTQTQDEATGGTPTPHDDEATHEFTVAYSTEPVPILVNKCDWSLYVKSCSIADNVVTVVIGIGGSGSADALEYDIHIQK